MVARSVRDAEVAGSNPAVPTRAAGAGVGSGPPLPVPFRSNTGRLTKALHPVSLVASAPETELFAYQDVPSTPGADDKLAQDDPAARRSRDARRPQRRHLGIGVVGRALESGGRGRQGQARRPQPAARASWSSSTTRRRCGSRRPRRSSWTRSRPSRPPTPSPPAPPPSCRSAPSPRTRAWARSSTSCSGAESFTEFSDRLQFMGALAQDDADLATEAQIAGQKSRWAAQQYGEALTERQATLDEIASHKGQIESAISEQAALYSQMSTRLQGRPRRAGGRRGAPRRGADLVGQLVGIEWRRLRVRAAAERDRRPRSPSRQRSP